MNSDYVTKQDVQEIVDKAVNDLSAVMQSFMTQVSERFDEVDTKFAEIDSRFDKVDSRFIEVDSKFIGINSKLSRIEKNQEEMRDWLEKVDNRLMGVESDIRESSFPRRRGSSTL